MLAKMQKEFHSLLVEMQNDAVPLEEAWQFLTKVNIVLPHNITLVILGTHPN